MYFSEVGRIAGDVEHKIDEASIQPGSLISAKKVIIRTLVWSLVNSLLGVLFFEIVPP